MDNSVTRLRFAPSPNGLLHLGHARSALINQFIADALGVDLLLRVEDIDQTRCTPELESLMLEDLAWLGLEWDRSRPIRRQSEHFAAYREALDDLMDVGLVYPSFMSRGDIKRAVQEHPDWPKDPDGAPHYPGDERHWSVDQRQAVLEEVAAQNKPVIYRLDMKAAILRAGRDMVWHEIMDEAPWTILNEGQALTIETHRQDVSVWGDVVLARADVPTSYHLSVVVDDGLQAISHVVRGQDLYAATGVHRLLQELLGLPAPLYHHHGLVLGEDGRKLSKSAGDTSLRALREAGLGVIDITRMAGLSI